MFQIFEDHQGSARSTVRVARLREELSRQALDGFVVPRSDEHQGEYVAAYAERLSWLTGFDGSAGSALLMRDKGAIFVDGRYTLQAREQVDTAIFEPHNVADCPPDKWISENVRVGQRIGFDPWLHTVNQIKRLQKACKQARIELVSVSKNPIDAVWADQPALPRHQIIMHQIQYAGEHARTKLAKLSEALTKAQADTTVLTAPDSTAWAFNIRGSDVSHTPICLAFAILHAEAKPELFIAQEKIDETVRDYLEDLVILREPSELLGALRELGTSHKRVLIDPAVVSQAIADTLSKAGAQLVNGPDLCLLPKARKNETEVEGTRAAHERDAVALCRFLSWFDREAPKGRLDEIKAAKELELFRTETGKLRDISFSTISGWAANGAIVHYRVTEASNQKITGNGLYLVDSGAQYFDGTTDITRTIAVGQPSSEMKDRFTRVLRGHIAIATARFPTGTSGSQLDALARRPLWDVGLDFDHGTGHGVGSYLSVHEGPQRISKAGSIPLEPGMIISNEPGYYKEGEYGIRIENLLLVREPTLEAEEEREMMRFETLSWAPIDLSLVDASMMLPDEVQWLDDYHEKVWEVVSPRLREKDRKWLERATKPINAKARKKNKEGGGWFS